MIPLEQVEAAAAPIGDPLETVAAFATALGAHSVVHAARRFGERLRRAHQFVAVVGSLGARAKVIECHLDGDDLVRARIAQQLCLRLQHFLFELQLALTRGDVDSVDRLNALDGYRVLGQLVIEAHTRSREREPEREQLASRLAEERTKFLMAIKADVLIVLEDALRQSTPSRRYLRQAAAEAASEIGGNAVEDLRARARAHMTDALEASTTRLRHELHSAMAYLPTESLTLVGFDLFFRARAVSARDEPATIGVLAYLVDQLGLASRQRVQRGTQKLLIRILEHGSQTAIDELVEEYDAARAGIEARWCELFEEALAVARFAASFAREAHQAGAECVRRSQQQVMAWSEHLASFVEQLPDPQGTPPIRPVNRATVT